VLPAAVQSGAWSCRRLYEAGAIRFGAPQIGIGRTLGRRVPVIVLLARDEHVHTPSSQIHHLIFITQPSLPASAAHRFPRTRRLFFSVVACYGWWRLLT